MLKKCKENTITLLIFAKKSIGLAEVGIIF
jgi:hypothetical protein